MTPSVEPGQLLVAVPGMLDPNFDATAVYLFDASEAAAGLVLTRPTDLRLTDAMPQLSELVAEPPVLFQGGPIGVDHALILGVSDSGITLLDSEEAAIASPGSIRVFAGYAGWGPGQLDAELATGGWFVLPSDPSDILTPDPLGLWRTVFARQSGAVRRYRNYPDQPGLN